MVLFSDAFFLSEIKTVRNFSQVIYIDCIPANLLISLDIAPVSSIMAMVVDHILQILPLEGAP